MRPLQTDVIDPGTGDAVLGATRCSIVPAYCAPKTPSIMSIRRAPDTVEPALRRAEAKVAHHLEEACEEADQKDLSQESMDELLRLEDELLAAARAIEDTVRLRRRLGDQPATGRDSPTSTRTAAAPQPETEPAGCRLREFKDAEGREWRAWEVKPGSSGRPTNPERYLGEYFKGWLAFECDWDEMRKRLPGHPHDWFRMADADLDGLLPRAVAVPKRKAKGGSAATT
jgi:hypothetical protein